MLNLLKAALPGMKKALDLLIPVSHTALQMELVSDNIHLSLILPSETDTPGRAEDVKKRTAEITHKIYLNQCLSLVSASRNLGSASVPYQLVIEGDAKHNKLPAIWFSILSATRNGGYIPLANLNQKSNFFLSRRYVSTSVATDTTERFKCQHETRGRLCKTLEKRNILDHKRRLLAYKYELRRKLYKAVCRDPDLPVDMRGKHRCKLSKLPRNSSFVRVRNRCISTGRPHAILRMFRMSRIVFREKASQGSLMGVKKSSW